MNPTIIEITIQFIFHIGVSAAMTMIVFVMVVLLGLVVQIASQEVMNDKPFILRVSGANGSPLRLSSDPNSQIIGSIAEGSMIAAYEELIIGEGDVKAYRVGETEGWVMEGVELVSKPDPEAEAAEVEEVVTEPEEVQASASINTEAERKVEEVEEEGEKDESGVAGAPEPPAPPAPESEGNAIVEETSMWSDVGTSAIAAGMSMLKGLFKVLRKVFRVLEGLLGMKK